MNKKKPGKGLLPDLLIGFLFASAGLLSTYLYFVFSDSAGFLLPGLLYTSTTILVFVLLGISFNARNITIYYFLMFFTYLFIWLITLISSWFGFIIGIITAGTGSMISFYITNKFILEISYNSNRIFAWGSLAFLLTDILYWSGESSFVSDLLGLEPEPMMLFGEVFFFWHIIVGLNLLYILRKNQQKQ